MPKKILKISDRKYFLLTEWVFTIMPGDVDVRCENYGIIRCLIMLRAY